MLCFSERNELLFFNTNYNTCYKNSVGIKDYENMISIYPNPANNVIVIENTDNLGFHSISILNIQGQTVREYDVASTQLDVSDITAGIYFIKFSTSSGNIIQKIVINQ